MWGRNDQSILSLSKGLYRDHIGNYAVFYVSLVLVRVLDNHVHWGSLRALYLFLDSYFECR